MHPFLTSAEAHIGYNAHDQVERLQRADREFMDRVNMYSSFYVATRKGKTS